MFGKAPRGATQRPSVKPATQPQQLVPGWLWMIFGILMGLFVMILLYLWQPWRPANRPIDTTQSASETPAPEQTNQDYQFYELLPKQQVTPVPHEAVPDAAAAAAQTAASAVIVTPASERTASPPEQDNASNAPAAEAAPAAPQYLLQVNSYQQADEADARRAEILLVGLPADVRQTTLADGTVWFRVISGPFANKAEAINAQGLLQDSGIDSLVVEQRR